MLEMITEMERIWKEPVVAQFGNCYSSQTEENRGNATQDDWRLCRNSNFSFSEYKFDESQEFFFCLSGHATLSVNKFIVFFYVLLTVPLSIILVIF
jgi:hypothetical protein